MKGWPNNKFSNSKQISALVSKEIQKIAAKQDEPEKGLDVEAYIAGMVPAAVARMQANQPESASDSKVPRRSPINSQRGKEQLHLTEAGSVLTLQGNEGEHEPARQGMGSWRNNKDL